MISVITPTYNRAGLIGKMINSVINQSYKNWELIIVDDGSTDNTEEIVTQFQDSRIRYYKFKNSGAGAQRNRGVGLANGDFIVFLDSDDSVEPNWLEMFSRKLDGKNTIVTCASKKINERGEVIGIRRPENLGNFFDNLELNFLAGSMLLPKEIFMEVGGYDSSLPAGQHTDLLVRLLPLFRQFEVHIEQIEEPLVNILYHTGEKIRQNPRGVFSGNKILMVKHKERFQQFPDKHFDFLAVTAVAAFKIGKVDEGKKMIKTALKLKPFNYVGYFRFLISSIPVLRNKIWLKSE